MSDEKKTYNGRIKFHERGKVGIRDYDDNVIISPELGYDDIIENDIDAAIVPWYIVSNPPEQKLDHLLFFSTLAVNGIEFLKQFHNV